MKKAFLILAAVALLVAWMVLRRPPASHSVSLRPAPDFTLTGLTGDKVSLSDYRGKVVLLDFWATWCAPCKEEIPHFVDLQNRYGERGLQIIGVSMDDDEKLVREFQEQFRMNYPVAIGSAKLAEQYGGVLGLPITFVIDSEGRIVSRHIGQTSADVFEAEIRRLLVK